MKFKITEKYHSVNCSCN